VTGRQEHPEAPGHSFLNDLAPRHANLSGNGDISHNETTILVSRTWKRFVTWSPRPRASGGSRWSGSAGARRPWG
jgi:hypothetical protein